LFKYALEYNLFCYAEVSEGRMKSAPDVYWQPESWIPQSINLEAFVGSLMLPAFQATSDTFQVLMVVS